MNYLTRAQWGATFDVSNIQRIRLPVSLLFVHHNVIEPTANHSYDMERTEQTDIARFGKPSYDWGVHPSGVVLEGMQDHLSPDTIGHNSDSLSIMFMGNFEIDEPTDAAIMGARELVQLLRDRAWVTPGVVMKGHRDVFQTACPGAHLYPRIQELLIPPTVQKEDKMIALVQGDNDPQGNWWITDYFHKWHVPSDPVNRDEVLAEIATSTAAMGVPFERNKAAEHVVNGRIIGSLPISRTQVLVDALKRVDV